MNATSFFDAEIDRRELARGEELELVVELLVSSGDVDYDGDCHCGSFPWLNYPD